MTLKDLLNKELAEFERLTGTGNLKHANHVLARIIKQLMLMIETHNPSAIDSTSLIENGYIVGFDKDGVLRNADSFGMLVSNTPVSEEQKEFNQIPLDTFMNDDDEWNMPERQPITEEVIDRAEKADAEESPPNPPLGALDPDELDDSQNLISAAKVSQENAESVMEEAREFLYQVKESPEVESTEDDPTDEPPNEPVEEPETEDEHKPTKGRKKSAK